MAWARLRVPASSANLGPGFDALGLALNLYLECDFCSAPELRIDACGCDAADIPADETNLIWQTAQCIARQSGLPLNSISLRIRNEIPLGKGLGSSAAALIAGVVIADHLLQLKWTRQRILDEAARLEGHPDNVAACVLGGIAISAIDGNGAVCAIRLELPSRCSLALAIPNFVLPTAQSRALLPLSYGRDDVIYNLQRAGLLVAAFASGRTDVLGTALTDRLHQPYRASLIPGFSDLLEMKEPGLFGCVLSGAGPSALIFYDGDHPDVPRKVELLLARFGQTVPVSPIAVSECGFVLWR